MEEVFADYDFAGAHFDLGHARDREIVRFILSQALFGEATGVYCGKSLYQARSLQAARFYLRQARQELSHLELFAQIFRLLELEPSPGHWVIRLLSSHNNYYPLKVLMEHAIGEGMVLDVFKDLLLQTLPDDGEHAAEIKKKLRVVCRDEAEHVAWGEQETLRILKERPWYRLPFYGLLELSLAILPFLVKRFHSSSHPVLDHLPRFMDHVRRRALFQGRRLGYVPAKAPSKLYLLMALFLGVALYVRSRFTRSRSVLDKTYLTELGFEPRS